jgi:TRAP-type uncharacterized transport system substrate-binding protein
MIALIPVIKNIIKHWSCCSYCWSNNLGLDDIKNKNPRIKIKEEMVKTDGLENDISLYMNRFYLFFLVFLINNFIGNMASIGIPDLSFLNRENRSSNMKKRNYDTVSTLGMLTAFLVILLIFLLIAINNIWIFTGFFILASLLSMWNSINNNKSMYPSLIIIVVGLIIVFWQYHDKIISHLRKKEKENFYTLFQPFQPYRGTKPPPINTVSLSNTTTDLLKYRTKPLNYGYQLSDAQTANFLGKLFLSKAKISNIHLKPNNSYEDICYNLNQNKLDIALIPAPIINKGYMGYLTGYVGKHMKNLQFIANIQRQYMFCISSIKSGIQNIHQLRNKRVGIPPRLKSIWADIEPSIFPDGHSIKFTYENQYKLVQDLYDYKLDSIFYCGQYPNSFLNEITSSELAKSYQIVPIMLNNETEFLNRNKHYRKYILSLDYDYMPSLYLPSGLGRLWKSNYTPEYYTLGFDLTLVCTNKLDDFTGYQLVKTIVEGRKLLIRNTNTSHLIYIGDPFTPADIASPSLPRLHVQNGAKKFYISKGLISYCKDLICMTNVGYKRCAACDKKEYDYETGMQWRGRIIAEKMMKMY